MKSNTAKGFIEFATLLKKVWHASWLYGKSKFELWAG